MDLAKRLITWQVRKRILNPTRTLKVATAGLIIEAFEGDRHLLGRLVHEGLVVQV